MRFSILHIEDDQEDAKLVERVLRLSFPKISIKQVYNLKDFIKEIEYHQPDLVLSNYGLSTYSGELFLKTCRIEMPDVPFIFFTSAPTINIRSKLLGDGASEVINKSEIDRLPEVITDCLFQIKKDEEAAILKSLLRQISDPIIVKNDYGFITHVSDIACLQLGKRASDLIGKRKLDVPVDFRPIYNEDKDVVGEIGHLQVSSAQIAKHQLS
ncbi:MAG: response regulator [Marinoscillum sp.]